MNPFSDIAFFSLLIKKGSLYSAAQEMGVTPPAVSKRLANLEARLGVRLLNRTTRRISLTPEGDIYLIEGSKVLEDLETLEQSIARRKATPRGTIRMGATLGFGRKYIAPALSKFVRTFQDVEIQLHLTDKPINALEQNIDLFIHFGNLPDTRLSSRILIPNKRILCASPKYLLRHGIPQTPKDLTQHQCIFLRESNETFGSWHLYSGNKHETIKVRGQLTTNDGESATAWALEGHGVLMRSIWEVDTHLRTGRLQQILTDWTLPSANISLVFPEKNNMSAAVRALVDFLVESFKDPSLAKTK
jgi:DNA-binding transcriptional LysR family regulator